VSFAAERSIDRWRAAWGDGLRDADEIRCFSESSRRLVERAYPGVGDRAIVVPHEVEPLRRVEVPLAEDGTLVLGVIGFISHHKGADVVADLARTIAAEGAPVRIVILGHVDARCPPHVVEQTGPYRREELPVLVERHGIGMVFLPSICPETFSFVAHEVLAMGLPLACLDLGAQADLARAHPRGHVARHADGPGLLAEILDFAATVGVAPATLRGAPA
jgi:glycosyltransferase involved in cell wall biosynthesis